jgi:histidine ammonia-lyase
LIHKVRNHKGQIETAATIYSYLKDSAIATNPNKQVQDPYSFRCVPQVHGATIDTFNYVLGVFMNEVNGVTDNPNIFPDEDLIVSGGNFHGQPLALSIDFFSIAMSEIASISERRTYQLISGQRGLPLFLVNEPGLNSGFMIPQYTAASIVSQNKQLCTPASVDTISSSNNQEDHVSMGANAATKCYQIIENVERVLAIELMTAAQALDFRKPEKTSPFLENILNDYRAKVSFNQKDRLLHTDMQATVNFLNEFALN